MSNFRQVDRETGFLLPASVDEWLPERHLARFVVDVVDQLELSAFVKAYRGSGSASYHPSVLLGLLVYGYATGVFSSRKLERATYDSVAFRFIAANDQPDHDTIAAFRRRFLGQIEGLFVEVLVLAREAGMLRLGTVALDGTKVHANASRHSALSYKHASEIEARLEAEVAELMALAEAADGADVPDGMSVPEELACCSASVLDPFQFNENNRLPCWPASNLRAEQHQSTDRPGRRSGQRSTSVEITQQARNPRENLARHGENEAGAFRAAGTRARGRLSPPRREPSNDPFEDAGDQNGDRCNSDPVSGQLHVRRLWGEADGRPEGLAASPGQAHGSACRQPGGAWRVSN